MLWKFICVLWFQAKIAKRGRKLVDYDVCRHNLQAQESAKKPDDTKITKVRLNEIYGESLSSIRIFQLHLISYYNFTFPNLNVVN